jgi:hypothetical protein
MVILFGDHRARVSYSSTAGAGGDGPVEYVPFMIHRVGEQLATQQVSRTLPIAFSGELTILDAASYVHRLFKKESSNETN